MKPYYQDEAVTIYHADCRDILPELPQIDLVLTDPPYGINYNLEDWDRSNLTAGKPRSTVLGKIAGDDCLIELSWLFSYPKRIIWGFPYIYDAHATGWLVWDKAKGEGMGTPVEMASSTLWKGFRLERCVWAGYMRETVYPERYEHPTQKPFRIFSDLIAKYSKPNDLIFDPFLGSGTTTFCAKKLNRKCIGIEIEEKYCELAANRCRQMVMDLGTAEEVDIPHSEQVALL